MAAPLDMLAESRIAWWSKFTTICSQPRQEAVMRQFRSRRSFLRPIAAVLLAVCLSACTKWTMVPEPKTLASHPRSTVRLTLVGDATRMVVKHPTVVGDSIVWTEPQRSGIPLSKVAWAEARSLDPVATGFFALVGVTFLLVKTLRQ
jgi:hypothetical protein